MIAKYGATVMIPSRFSSNVCRIGKLLAINAAIFVFLLLLMEGTVRLTPHPKFNRSEKMPIGSRNAGTARSMTMLRTSADAGLERNLAPMSTGGAWPQAKPLPRCVGTLFITRS